MKTPNQIALKIADELLNKTIYEILHSDDDFSSICVVSTKKMLEKLKLPFSSIQNLSLTVKKCVF